MYRLKNASQQQIQEARKNIHKANQMFTAEWTTKF